MPRFSLRFNLKDPHQKKAWELLCAVPEGQRSAYVTELLYRSATAFVSIISLSAAP